MKNQYGNVSWGFSVFQQKNSNKIDFSFDYSPFKICGGLAAGADQIFPDNSYFFIKERTYPRVFVQYKATGSGINATL